VQAILGPAVAGKTTLLNFLSGRLAGKNIIIHGNVKINGVLTKDIGKYSKVIAYEYFYLFHIVNLKILIFL